MPTQALRPLIGISTRLDYEKNIFYLNRDYGEAVYHAGGAPVYIPLVPEADFVESLISDLDGVLLSGSKSDVDPVRYDQAPHIKLGSVVYERDETDNLLLRACEARKIPVLAICYGLQALNVYRGGTLLQDLESLVETPIQHQQQGPYDRASHNIELRDESLLAILAGGIGARVNSHHHQGIDRLGRDLEIIAQAADGVIEAVINTRPDHFILGVQWHPEAGWRNDQFSQAIFKHFIARSMRK